MRWIYVSPHLDDAILSCGGLIHKQVSSGIIVDIWTICAGDPPEGPLSPFAIKQHEGFLSGSHYCKTRRSEDITACQLIGARYRHIPFEDCIYRKSLNGNWFYESEEAIFGELSPDEDTLIQDISNFINLSIKPNDQLVSPLAIGNHVDHQIVKKSLEMLDIHLKYYADIPYAIRHNEVLTHLHNDRKPETHDLSEDDVSAWKDSISAYSSQIEILFGNTYEMSAQIDEYIESKGCFHLWSQF